MFQDVCHLFFIKNLKKKCFYSYEIKILNREVKIWRGQHYKMNRNQHIKCFSRCYVWCYSSVAGVINHEHILSSYNSQWQIYLMKTSSVLSILLCEAPFQLRPSKKGFLLNQYKIFSLPSAFSVNSILFHWILFLIVNIIVFYAECANWMKLSPLKLSDSWKLTSSSCQLTQDSHSQEENRANMVK